MVVGFLQELEGACVGRVGMERVREVQGVIVVCPEEGGRGCGRVWGQWGRARAHHRCGGSSRFRGRR